MYAIEFIEFRRDDGSPVRDTSYVADDFLPGYDDKKFEFIGEALDWIKGTCRGPDSMGVEAVFIVVPA